MLKEWDPIGVSGIVEAQDEYDTYVSSIYKLIIQRKPEYEIFDYLWSIETDSMGLIGDRQRTLAVARKFSKL